MQKRKILPPHYFIIGVIIMITLHMIFPFIQLINGIWQFIGIVLVFLGLTILVLAYMQFKKAGTEVIPFKPSIALVTTGLFKFSRNPMYLGMVFSLCGIFVILGSLTPVMIIPIFISVITIRFIIWEEKYMEEQFGDTYREYKKCTRRWV